MRESVGAPGRYVLTGMQNNQRKHLLLVDAEGVVSCSLVQIFPDFFPSSSIYRMSNCQPPNYYFSVDLIVNIVKPLMVHH